MRPWSGLFDGGRRRRWRAGLGALDRGDLEAAAVCFEVAQAEARVPGDHDHRLASTQAAGARAGLGHAFIRAGDYARAGREFSRALDADPHRPDLRYWRARVLEHSGLIAEALADLEWALVDDPAHVEALLLLAVCMDSRGVRGDPAAALDRALEAVIDAPLPVAPRLLDSGPEDGEESDVHFVLGLARFRARAFARAAQALERESGVQGRRVRAHRLLGLAYHALGRRADALRAVRRGLIRQREAPRG